MIRYIIEGDIYIANMTQQLTIESEKQPLDVFYDLRKNNPSPFWRISGFRRLSDRLCLSGALPENERPPCKHPSYKRDTKTWRNA